MAELDPVKLNKFRNAMVAKGYPLNKIDQYLTTKTKQYGKTESVGTEDEREKNRARIALRKDAMEGVPYYELGPKYGQILEPYEIEEEYMKGPTAGKYGKPKEPQEVQQRWKVPPKAPSADTSNTFEDILDTIGKMQEMAIEPNIIVAFIKSKGKNPASFGYKPEEPEKPKQKNWWNPFD